MPKSTFTVVGNLGADPELRATAAGVPYVRFRVAESDSWRDQATGAWVDGPTNWWDVTCWDELAENVAASVKRGSRVVVSGTFEQREYLVGEGADAERRRSTTLKARSVALDLRRGIVRQFVRDRAEQGAAPVTRVDSTTGVVTDNPWATAGVPGQASAPADEQFDPRSLHDYGAESSAADDDPLEDAPLDGDDDARVELSRSA
ncbi:single-strand DNA-binding protein [Quadrisphaera granulorum]|uniref:Single-stranded DNA-binding protein n=1 Tax=Quadrisphaera granulorum TaxID=317664 RepID=A0A315ZP25_9ACTN|nr:single-stranded DNA-binding protein [Quadrisphaera granulorum]PWJ47385.1 single-strand DNA-binding protein [Quadrisphaera granulorum]SZE98832.1 single-strand DNA-binding protein [Quadrisphaera granulorum]